MATPPKLLITGGPYIFEGCFSGNKIGSENWHIASYRKLAQHTEKELKKICKFIHINYDVKMLNFKSANYWGLGGNKLRRGKGEEIFYDDTWRQNLSKKYQLKFLFSWGWLQVYVQKLLCA